jgi:hypothetical protein
VERRKRRAPIFFSNRATLFDTADGVVFKSRAAALNEPASTVRTKAIKPDVSFNRFGIFLSAAQIMCTRLI